MDTVAIPNGHLLFISDVRSPEQMLDYLNIYVLARTVVNEGIGWKMEALEAFAISNGVVRAKIGNAYVQKWSV